MGLLLMLGLWVILTLLMWGWIYLWNRKWVGSHKGALGFILLIVFALPSAMLWANIQSADKVLHDKYRLGAEVQPLNGWIMRGVFDNLPSHLAEDQQAEHLFTALCRKTKCLLPYEDSYRFVPPAELHDTLRALYHTRSLDRERERIYQNNKERLDTYIRRSLAEAQYHYNEAELREWTSLCSNPSLRTFAIFWLIFWSILLAGAAYADIRQIYPV